LRLNFSNPTTAQPLLPEGIYSFKAGIAKDAVSKRGSEMIEVTLTITDASGTKSEIRDWFGAWNTSKIVEFFHATGLQSIIERGEIRPSDLIGATGRCVVAIKPATGPYRESNEVKSYLPAPMATSSQVANNPNRASERSKFELPADFMEGLD
jgi:hypothetical protein